MRSSYRPARSDRAASIRMAAIFNMVLGALAIGTILLASNRLAALWIAGFVGAGLLIWGAVDAWAAWGANLRGTKLLAMFMAILGIILGASSFLIQEGGLYRAVTIVLGLLVFAVSIVDAFMSPDEDRHDSFEPRRADDLAPGSAMERRRVLPP